MSEFWDELFHLLFPAPRKCLICGQKTNDNDLCSRCHEKINLLKKQEFCRKCGKFIEISSKKKISLCKDCFRNNYVFDFARSVFVYKDIIKDLIYQLKYEGKRSLAVYFSKMMINTILEDRRFINLDLIIPVPMSPNKLAERRFNQSELLAVNISRFTGITYDAKNLIKVKDTVSQSKLTKKGRGVNLKGAFLLRNRKSVEGLRVLLVDDIYTTGNTINECSKILLKAGAQSIKVITIATGLDS